MLLPLGWVAGPGAVLAVWAGKLLVQGLLAYLCFRRVGAPGRRLELLPAFELYTIGLSLSLTVFRLLPVRFEWKGRRY